MMPKPRLTKQVVDGLRGTFETSVRNKRGVTSRPPYDGEEQDPTLAEKYQGYADRCQIEFPLASKALADIARSYEQDDLSHDRAAERSKDRY